MFTKTMIAKHVVTTIVAAGVQSALTTIITNNTEKDEDEFIVKVPTAVVGFVVANKFRTQTDAMVDAVACKIETFRNRKDTTE